MARRIPLRFGLRTLLLLMLLSSVALTVWVRVVRPYSEQASTIAWLERLGATVTSRPATGPAWWRPVVETIAGAGAYSETTGVEMENVELPELAAGRLTALRWLESLHLDGADFDGDAAACLAGMSRLETLSVRYTGFDDAGALIASRLPSLRTLRITGTEVTDTGLAALASAPRLEEVFARWSKITAGGAAAFRDANSTCLLHAHQLPP